jgi:hypothetical protein
MNHMEDQAGVVHMVRADLMSASTECGAGTVEDLELRETGSDPTCEGCREANPVSTILNDQGALEPGTDGYWTVHGACVLDIRAGDLVMARGSEGPTREYVITEAIEHDGGMADMCAPRFETANAGRVRLGIGMRVVVARPGTHRTLSPNVR